MSTGGDRVAGQIQYRRHGAGYRFGRKRGRQLHVDLRPAGNQAVRGAAKQSAARHTGE